MKAQPLTPDGEKIAGDLALRHGFSVAAVTQMMNAVLHGNGSMAQFSHSEFGGSGQWMRGGMLMLGDMTDLQPPDIEMRLAILKKKAQVMNVLLQDDILNFLATRIRTNVRRLEGALIRVASFASLTGKKLTIEIIEGLLREILHEEGRMTISIEVIQKKVAEHFDIRLADMTSKRRPENIAFPRQIAMYLSRQLTESSLNTIGEAFGGRDHGTVLHACRLVKDRMEVDSNVRQVVHYLEKQLMR